MWKARPLSLQSCIVVLFILNPQNPIQTLSLDPRVGWVYFLLEAFPCSPELADWRALKSISKELGPLPIGANPAVSTSVPAAVAWVEADLFDASKLWNFQEKFNV